MEKGFFKGTKVLVMGLGRFGGGADTARFAVGAGACVRVTDMAPKEKLEQSLADLSGFDIEYRLGSHDPEDFRWADVVVVNPAVPFDNKFVQMAIDAGKIVTTQIDLFFELFPGKIVGITGANGKSTTTALTGHLLRAGEGANFRKVWVGGNIGNQPLLCKLDEMSAEDVTVLELSSFQTEVLKKGPEVALLTNLTANHLDRHGCFENYCAAKRRLFELQEQIEGAVSIFNFEDTVGADWYQWFSNEKGRKCLKYLTGEVDEKFKSVFPLPGKANLSNLSAAIKIARCFGITDEQILAVLGDFRGLEHRLEFVAGKGGVNWYNDSIATTPQSTIAALNAFETRKTVLIAGGYDKKLDFSEMGSVINERAKAVILIGQTAGQIEAAVDKPRVKVLRAQTLEQAVEFAKNEAEAGDSVLLSPACASYDMFENFQQRGLIFKQLVGLLD